MFLIRKLKFQFTIILSGLLILTGIVSAQNVSGDKEKKHLAVCVAFYNVENLFDTINDPGRNDEEFTPEGTNRWNSARYFEKLDRLAEVISVMGTDVTPDGPALIGLAEVENGEVVKDLARQERIKDRNYRVVHHRGSDARIDNAFMYNPRYFQLTSSKSIPVRIEDMPDFRTRDHLLVSGLLIDEPVHIIVAHWPSRRGGERRSRPLRIAAAEHARAIIDSLKAIDPEVKIIFMGDLNDDPSDVSVKKHLNTHGDKSNLKKSQLFNPFEDYFKRGIGTLAYQDSWNLFDQIILSKSLLGEDKTKFRFLKAEVFNKPFLRQSSGRFQGYPFRSYGGGVYLGGYSDHFPTCIYLIREIK